MAITSINPATGETLKSVHCVTRFWRVEERLKQARKTPLTNIGASRFRAEPSCSRQSLLICWNRKEDQLARLMTAEMGKLLRGAVGRDREMRAQLPGSIRGEMRSDFLEDEVSMQMQAVLAASFVTSRSARFSP